MRTGVLAAVLVVGAGAGALAIERGQVSDRASITLADLLEEMVDRDALARWPQPAYRTGQFSSYDRRSVSPEDPEGWFANADAGHFLRTEDREGRTEHVLMDAQGPGAIVRIWSANPRGTLRVYLDGSEEPAIEAPMADFLAGRWPGDAADDGDDELSDAAVGGPLKAVRSRGYNSYLPIPYARQCVVTSDEGGFYYHVNYRTYEPDAAVESFSMRALEEARPALERVQRALSSPGEPAGERPPVEVYRDGLDLTTRSGFPLALLRADQEPQRWVPARQLKPSEAVLEGDGARAIRSIKVRLRRFNPRTREVRALAPEELDRVSRAVTISIDFDGKRLVWAPVGEFFGSGVGLRPFEDWFRTVRADGTLISRWVMPYEDRCVVTLHNGDRIVDVWADVEIEVGAWDWDDRTMHFNATWVHENPIPTRPFRDWNYVTIQGRGVYVGDTLSVMNPVPEWWGEGDEKIYVDGEEFPSHFGTGTEDYYGYAWCSPEPFEAPFHAQPRADGYERGNNWGHTANTRVRALDAIPFESSLKVDMEVWHWKETEVAYAASTYFYAFADSTRYNRVPDFMEAAKGPARPPPLPPVHRIEGAVEAEAMEVLGTSEGLEFGPQHEAPFSRGLWSNEQQLWVRAREVGDFIELGFAAGDSPQRLEVHATRSWDYGIVRFFVNGQRVRVGPDGDVDLYNTEGREVVSTGPLDLGVHVPEDGRFTLRVEVVGSNPDAAGTGTYFGLDCVVAHPVGEEGDSGEP